MFLVFWFLRFLCKFAFLRTRGGNKEWFFHRFFCIHPHYVTRTKIESRDFALIFLGKRPFNTLSKIELSDIVIVTLDFYVHSAQEMLLWNSQCHTVPILSLPQNHRKNPMEILTQKSPPLRSIPFNVLQYGSSAALTSCFKNDLRLTPVPIWR